MTTICKESHEATLEQSAIPKRNCGEGALVFMERGGEKREERRSADDLSRQSRVCRILRIDAGRGCRIIAAP